MHGACAKRFMRVAALAAGAVVVLGCGRQDLAPTGADAPSDPVVPATTAVIAQLHVPLDRVERISRFRSGVGHDYNDGAERCRSMKHYFQFTGGEPGEPHAPSWTTVPIVSPLDGVVVGIDAEWAGDQIRIRSAADPRLTVILFHVRRNADVGDGLVVRAGQALGFHASDETMSDLAVEVEDASVPHGRRLVSAFDAMGDAAFTALMARGVGTRAALIIGQAERDARPLVCDGERFASAADGSDGSDWVALSRPSDPSYGVTPTP